MFEWAFCSCPIRFRCLARAPETRRPPFWLYWRWFVVLSRTPRCGLRQDDTGGWARVVQRHRAILCGRLVQESQIS